MRTNLEQKKEYLVKYNIEIEYLYVNISYLTLSIIKNYITIDIESNKHYLRFLKLLNEYLKNSIKHFENLSNIDNNLRIDIVEDKYRIFSFILNKNFDKYFLLQYELHNKSLLNILKIFDNISDDIDYYNTFKSNTIEDYISGILNNNVGYINDYNIKHIVEHNSVLSKKFNYLIQAKNFDLL